MRAGLLVLTALLTVWHQALGNGAAALLATLSLAGYLLFSRGQLNRASRGVLLACLALTLLALARHPQPWSLLARAGEQFAFLASFLAALSLLRLPATRSRLARRCGRAILSQPPGKRYPLLCLGATLFGIVLNFGVLNLLLSMVERANTLAAANGERRVQRARRRRMLLATLRGFTLAPLISPLGIGVAVILTAMPNIAWHDLFPYTLGAAVLLFVAGWGMDHLSHPRPSPSAMGNSRPLLRPLSAFVLLLLALVTLVFAIATGLGWPLSRAVLAGVPVGAWLWTLWQCRCLAGAGLPSTLQLFRRQAPPLLGAMANEVVALGAAGYLGNLLVGLVDPAAFAALVQGVDGLVAWAPVVAMLSVLLLAQVGVNPIISVTFLASLTHQADVEISLPLMAMAMMVGWSLAMLSSPFTASMVIVSRFARLPATRVGYRWNGGLLACAALGGGVLLWLAG